MFYFLMFIQVFVKASGCRSAEDAAVDGVGFLKAPPPGCQAFRQEKVPGYPKKTGGSETLQPLSSQKKNGSQAFTHRKNGAPLCPFPLKHYVSLYPLVMTNIAMEAMAHL